MKSIINRKVYDTETAEELHTYWNGLGGGDFRACRETLYRTKRGALFLHGRGGPMSPYAESCGDSTGGGSRIVPLTEQEAIDWLQDHDGEDVILEHFTSQIEEA